MIQYKIEIFKDELNINYYGELFKSNSQSVDIVYSYGNNWANAKKETMTKTENGFYINIKLEAYDTLNFCFSNEYGMWDNNNGMDYSAYIVKNVEQMSQTTKNTKCTIRDNGKLLISEVKDKVFLPYKGEEVLKILQSEDNDFLTEQEVIDNVFTKPFKDYRNQFTARFRETIELVTKREKMSLKDGIDLACEIFGKIYLHPAIIAACKNLDELNVYLDCLDKDELDDFKIFDISYEINPMIIKNENGICTKIGIMQKIINFIKRCFFEVVDIIQKA